VLHGDEGSTRVVLRLWKGSVEKRGYILLALSCPKDKGCNGSYWRWGGDPGFMLPSLDAVEASYNVDRARIYLSGWSGGSTYMGMSAPLLSPRFAALNLNAGGIPPEGSAISSCAPCKAPVYYFMGGKNPFAHLAESARDYYKRCGHDVVWDFGKNLDHPGELLALSKATTQERILAWFDAKRNACLSPAGGADAGPAQPSNPSILPTPFELGSDTAVSSDPPPPSGAPPPSAIPAEPSSPQSAASQPGCGCRGPSGSSATSPAFALYLFAIIARLRGRRR
jgi:MYXO-CTERM domain-containing protein